MNDFKWIKKKGKTCSDFQDTAPFNFREQDAFLQEINDAGFSSPLKVAVKSVAK